MVIIASLKPWQHAADHSFSNEFWSGMAKNAETLSIERRLRMYEAREAILNRIARETLSVIDLNHFLQATVTEVGKMMAVDRCDVMMLTSDGELRVTNEYLNCDGGDTLPSFLGAIPVDLTRLQESIDIYSPRAIEDTSSPELPEIVRTASEMMGTKSALLVPITFRWEMLGIIGLHYCRQTYHWMEDEINFVRSLAQQIAIGYRYTKTYSEKEKEARITKALLAIANDINTGSDFSEVTARILDRSVDLLRLKAACLAIVDANGLDIHITNLRTAGGVSADIVKEKNLRVPSQQMLPATVERGQTLKLLAPDQNPMASYFLTKVIDAGAAVIAPILIEDKIFGGLILLWEEPRAGFSEDELTLSLGICDQLAITFSKDRLSAEVLRLRRELEHAQSGVSGPLLVGKSDNIMRCLEMALYVADSYTTVLLEGESGTGKELMADLIQRQSSRADKPFVKINCGAIPDTLLESELFGHEKGAFTDARYRRIGKFEEANGGTLFLDEIGEMSLAAQVRLLRVLQNGEFTRVGGNEVIKVDVRVIAASNIDLEEAAREGKFRRDVFYRLNVYPIRLPALRERREDLPLLAVHFLDLYKKRSNKNITGITEKALSRLKRHDWPGNVRELENAVERAVILAQGRMITIDDLPEAVRGAESENDAKRVVELEIGTPIEEIEKRVILETLAYTKGDKSRTAQMLGIGRKTLYRKLQQYQQG
ncbi:MAG TPA: sigma-54-dependent Fis family transcriptional regulator [Blastocatellia bacterium]|nr:sigma-54-dependent Fis family transcriptional regulator [Blastocatellia bacterium]